MKILVTGGAGFIGSNFIRYWLSTHPNDSVVNFDLLTYAGNPENLVEVQTNPKYSFIKGDIADPKQVAQAMPGVELIVNFAAESHVDRSIADSSTFIRTNLLGTQVLLEAARNAGNIRYHQVSTDEVYGALSESDQPWSESSPYAPRSPYSASKAGADHLVRAYNVTYGLPATISNCSNNYGPQQFPEKLHGLFITNLLEGKNLPIYGDGLQIRDWLYVEDHCSAIAAILERGRIGESYCIAGRTELTNLDVAKKIIALLGESESRISFVADRPGHDRRYALNDSKIRTTLNWEPKTDFDTGLEKTIKWYQENQAWWKKLKA